MNTLSKAIIAALVFGGSISTATAGGVITGVTASGPGMGSFDAGVIDPNDHSLDFTKSFDSVNPITLTFTVAHTDGGGNPYSVAEALTNNSGVAWNDFHYSITEPPHPGNGVVFTGFNQSTLGGFTLALGYHARKRPLPTGFVAGHALLAVTAFLILLLGVLGLF